MPPIRLTGSWNERFHSDPSFRLRHNLRHAIWEALRSAGGKKDGRSVLNHLPYSMAELRAHLESQWEPWMTWANYGPLHPITRTWVRVMNIDEDECSGVVEDHPAALTNLHRGDKVQFHKHQILHVGPPRPQSMTNNVALN